MARGRKHKAKPAMVVAPAPIRATSTRLRLPRNPAFARTVILIGAAIPPVCGRIPEGPGYHRWC
jgi:hypothetical protein